MNVLHNEWWAAGGDEGGAEDVGAEVGVGVDECGAPAGAGEALAGECPWWVGEWCILGMAAECGGDNFRLVF